jgi:predicted dehydrogenase
MNNCKRFDYHDLISVPAEEFSIHEKIKIPLETRKRSGNKPSLRKMVFFIFREGVIRSFYKFRSSDIYSKCLKYQYFITGFHSKTGKYFSGLQISIRQPVFYFLPALQSDNKPDPDNLSGWFNYDPFHGYLDNCDDNPNESGHFISFVKRKKGGHNSESKSLYIIGGGRYVLTEILPVFRNYNMQGLCDFNFELLQNPVFSNFNLRTNDFDEIIEYAKKDSSEKLFIIASYHSYHTDQAARALKLVNAKVVIEKPPCITLEDFHNLLGLYDESRIYIAYHRRFAEWNIRLKEILTATVSPVMINMIIHEIEIPSHHWYFAPNQGTRISGNLCHWIDLAYFWISQKPARLLITRNVVLGIDSSVFNILFENGTLVNLIASDKGDGTKGVQENITIKGEGLDISVEDYIKMHIWRNDKKRHYLRLKRDKGHIKLNKYYTGYVTNGIPSPYTRKDFVLTTFTYIKFVEMWEKGEDIFVFGNDFYERYQIE